MTTDPKSISESARADLQQRINAALATFKAAHRRNDLAAADRHWRELIGLVEVQMGRTSSAEKLTMTPSPVAER